MIKYIEIATEIPVEIRGLPKWDGEPDLCEVEYEDGTRYGLTRATAERLFRIVTPQAIGMGAVGGGKYDRPLKEQLEAEVKP